MNAHDRWRLEHIADAFNTAMRFVRDRQRADLDSPT